MSLALSPVGDLDRLAAGLDGVLAEPGSSDYDDARAPALARFRDVRPRAVVRCASVADVARAIRFARLSGLHLVPRGGGHCFAGRSSSEGLVLDLARLDGIAVTPDGRAIIGAGARLGRVYDALHEHARTLPAGCGPTVGIAGLTLGGGLGLLGRRYGLTCDRLVGATVVLADGEVVECDGAREPDLFWALRGAGGGQFGVVTSLVFDPVPAPLATRFEVRWPAVDAAAVVAAWQDWAPDAPDDVSASLTVIAGAGQETRVVMFGCALRGAAPTRDLLAGSFAPGTRPQLRLRDDLSYPDLKRSFASLDGGVPASGADDPSASRSEFFSAPLAGAAIGELLEAMAGAGTSGRRELNFTPMGGAYNRVPAGATAFVHRAERFLLEHVGSGDAAAPWVERSWAIAHRHGSGRVYPNFPDPQLTDWAEAYHGPNHARLAAVKRRYDPGRLFRFPQSL